MFGRKIASRIPVSAKPAPKEQLYKLPEEVTPEEIAAFDENDPVDAEAVARARAIFARSAQVGSSRRRTAPSQTRFDASEPGVRVLLRIGPVTV